MKYFRIFLTEDEQGKNVEKNIFIEGMASVIKLKITASENVHREYKCDNIWFSDGAQYYKDSLIVYVDVVPIEIRKEIITVREGLNETVERYISIDGSTVKITIPKSLQSSEGYVETINTIGQGGVIEPVDIYINIKPENANKKSDHAEEAKKNTNRAGWKPAIIVALCVILIGVIGTIFLFSKPRENTAEETGAVSETSVEESSEEKVEPQISENDTQIETESKDNESVPEESLLETRLSQIPHYRTRYYISQLDDKLLNNFSLLYDAVKNHRESCRFATSVNKDELEALTFALKYDCPELFCLDTIDSYYYEEGYSNHNIISVNIKYLMSESEYNEKFDYVESKVEQISQMTSGDLYNKSLDIYEYLTENCDYNMYSQNCGTAYGAIIEKEAKCDGISLAYKWILEKAGVNCFVSAGTMPGDTLGHAWNIVGLNGKYYATDVTADLMNYISGKYDNWYLAFITSTDWVDNEYSITEVPKYFDEATGHDMSRSYHVSNCSFCSAEMDTHRMIYNAIDAAYYEDGYSLIQFESEIDFEYFIDNYESIVTDWATDCGFNGYETEYNYDDVYRTAQLYIDVY